MAAGDDDGDEERNAAPARTRRNNNNNNNNTNDGPPLPTITTNNAPQTSTSEIASGISKWLEASSPFLYVELASIVLLIACVSDWYATTWYKYALSVSLVSLIICLVLQTTEFVVPGFIDWKVGKAEEGYTVQQLCSVFLLFWWIVGTGIITFKGPFVTTSNGWFGAWGGLLATVKWSIGLKNISFFGDGSQPSGLRQLYNLAVCSVILLFASIPPLTQDWANKGGAGLAIAGSAITCIACAYFISMYSDVPRNMMKVTVVILFVLWVVVACVCTFHGPFLYTNNGFFAAWLGCLSAFSLLLTEMRDESPEHS
ncbi:hypothetical protein ACHAXH_004271 [Discostella pseudostelligera]